MAHEIRGIAAVRILREDGVIKEFSDSDNPIPIQILSGLGFIINKNDDFVIRKEYKELGVTAGGDMLRRCLIQRYSDQPEKFTLKQFIDVLINSNTNHKLTHLLSSASNSGIEDHLKAVSQGPTVSPCDSVMNEDIKASLQLMCENVRQVWGKLLNETSLEKCYVEPELVEEEIDEYGERRKKATGKCISNYKELFDVDTLGDRIIIEGEPGMGKTTYVNKLALDWTWDEGSENYSDDTQFLQSKFSNVFLIPLRTLNGSRETSFAQAASLQLDGCGSWLSARYKSSPTDSLLILDAFDEYDGSCPEINKIIDGSLFPRLKVIITTRPSHLERLTIKNQWLSITGLTTPEKREQFFIKQCWDEVQERNMIINVLSGFGTLWHTPLYLAMLCVLYKAKKKTGFDPRNPDCFYVLVKLFTDHIMSRKAKEGALKNEGTQLKTNQRQKLKTYMQKRAFDKFLELNPSISVGFKKPTTSDSEDLRELAGQVGLLTIREEQSPITGECVESVSFVHQLFLEYYAAVEFGTIFSSCITRWDLMEMIKENLGFTTSPFSYFLSAECKEYKEMLLRRQKCEMMPRWITIKIAQFPWLPEIQISKYLIRNVPSNSLQELVFDCSGRSNKSFWDVVYMKELCSIANPRKVRIEHAVLSCHDQSLEYILSSIKELDLWNCSCELVNLDKQYLNLTHFYYSLPISHSIQGVMSMLHHFPNLHLLFLWKVNLNKEIVNLLCDVLQSANQLQELQLIGCFKGPKSIQSIVQLAKTIETSSLRQCVKKLDFSDNILDTAESSGGILLRAISKCVQLETLDLPSCFESPESIQHVIQLANTIESLCQSLKELDLSHNILDAETESASDVLLRAISKCVQLEKLDLSYCQIRVQSLDIIKQILQNSLHSLKYLKINHFDFVPPHRLTKEDLDKWESEIKLILPHCRIFI